MSFSEQLATFIELYQGRTISEIMNWNSADYTLTDIYNRLKSFVGLEMIIKFYESFSNIVCSECGLCDIRCNFFMQGFDILLDRNWIEAIPDTLNGQKFKNIIREGLLHRARWFLAHDKMESFLDISLCPKRHYNYNHRQVGCPDNIFFDLICFISPHLSLGYVIEGLGTDDFTDLVISYSDILEQASKNEERDIGTVLDLTTRSNMFNESYHFCIFDFDQ